MSSLLEKPDNNEYGEYYHKYVHSLDNSPLIDHLSRQKSILLKMFKEMTDDQASFRYAEGKWSVKQGIGHMIDTEQIFCYRAISFARGEKQSLPGYDQDAYVENGRFDELSVEQLIRRYDATRELTLSLIDSLNEEELTKSGLANNNPVSVRAIFWIIAGHENHHIRIFKEKYGLK